MSQENVEVVRRALETFETGIEATLTVFSRDCVLYPPHEWVDAVEYRGHEGLREIAAAWTDNFDDFGIAAEEIRDLGDRVLVLGEQRGRIKGSGVPIRQPLGIVYADFCDGAIGEVRFFLSWNQGLEAAGRSE